MKTRLMFAASLVALSGVARNEILYVRHADGATQLFYSEIEKICYSTMSIDSVETGVPCVQEIWTVDSVYRYKIDDVVEVAFQPLPTVAVNGAVDLEGEIAPYVVGEEYDNEPVLLLSASVPDAMIPAVDRYVYQMNASTMLSNGFCARVTSVDRSAGGEVRVRCTSAEPCEVFEQITWAGTTEYYADETDDELETTPSTVMSTTHSRVYEGGGKLMWLTAYNDFSESDVVKYTDELADIALGKEIPVIKSRMAVRPTFACQVGVSVIPLDNGHSVKETRMRTHVVADVKTYIQGRHDVTNKAVVGNGKKISLDIPLGFGKKCMMTYVGTLTVGSGMKGVDFQYSDRFNSSCVTAVRYDNDDKTALYCVAKSNKQLGKTDISLDASMTGMLGVTGSLTFTYIQSGDSLKSVTNAHTYGAMLSGGALYRKSEIPAASENTSLYERLTATGITVKPIENVNGSIRFADMNLIETGRIASPAAQVFYAVPKFNSPSFDMSTGILSYGTEGHAMKSTDGVMGVAVQNRSGEFAWYSSGKRWPKTSTLAETVKLDVADGDVGYPTATLPTGERILGLPPYPYTSKLMCPFVTSMEQKGVRVVSGACVIGSAADGETSVHIGNLLPCNL